LLTFAAVVIVNVGVQPVICTEARSVSLGFVFHEHWRLHQNQHCMLQCSVVPNTVRTAPSRRLWVWNQVLFHLWF